MDRKNWPRLLHLARCLSCSPRLASTGTIDPMNKSLLNRITITPGLCGGRPCIRGMRIRVSDILELLASGASPEEILHDYPFLERDDILAALAFAAHQTDHPVVEVA